MIYQKYIKRILDYSFSLLLLILISPFLLLISFFVRIKLGSPVIFKQKRPGLNEKVFTLYKFRTMTDKKDEDGVPLSDSLRLTKFGKWLRSTSLDELPELWNILKGEMSFVGPRPLLVKYLSLYDEEQKKRHLVKPGITGLAQVKGRNQISWGKRFYLDILYVESMCFVEDLKIVILTFIKVFKKDGINSDNSETMEEFKGTLIKTGKYDEPSELDQFPK